MAQVTLNNEPVMLFSQDPVFKLLEGYLQTSYDTSYLSILITEDLKF